MTDSKALTLTPTNYDGFSTLAETFAKSKLIPSDLQAKPADVFVTLLAGHELGLTPMAAIRGIHVVKGKPILSADTMAAVVLASGACVYLRPVGIPNNEIATYETMRKGDAEPRQMSWSIEDTKRAGLESSDSHKKYPRAMNMARCKAVLLRDVYPDVLAGCYVEGEIPDDDVPSNVTPIASKRAAPITPPPSDVIDVEAVERPAGGSSLSWDAFVADVLTIAGLKVADESDVGEEWARMLGRSTRQEVDADTKGLIGAMEKHKSDYRVAALRAKCSAAYLARMAEFKGKAAAS